jgi:hypothetical protein
LLEKDILLSPSVKIKIINTKHSDVNDSVECVSLVQCPKCITTDIKPPVMRKMSRER